MTARLSPLTQRLAPARPPAPPRGAHIHLAARPSDQKALARVTVSTRQVARPAATVLAWATVLARARQSAARLNLPGPQGSTLPVVCGGSPPRPTVTVTPTVPDAARRGDRDAATRAAAGQRAAASGDASAGRLAAHTEAGPAAGRPQRSGTPRGVLTRTHH